MPSFLFRYSSLGWALAAAAAIVAVGRLPIIAQDEKTPPDPERFAKVIAEFEDQDKKSPPPTGAIVCTGSSSMRLWHDRIAQDLAPLTVIPRGFGGSMMHDLLHFADRIVLAYKPRAVVIYEGDNDTNFGISPRQVVRTFDQLVQKLHQHNPEMRVYFLAIKPSPRREAIWPVAAATNKLIQQRCEKDGRLVYIDVATPMLNSNGKPDPSLFIKDQLHMNRKGYELWRKVVRPVVLKYEADRESMVQPPVKSHSDK